MPSWLQRIAIGALCAVPFGLALRDELAPRGPDPHRDALLAREQELEATLAELETALEHADVARLVREGDQRPMSRMPPAPEPVGSAAATPLSDAALAELLGPAPASLGPLFEGVRVGAPSQGVLPDDIRTRIDAFQASHPVAIDVRIGDREILAVSITAPDPARLAAALTARWGAPLLDADTVWLDGRGTRVALIALADRAELRVERYQTVEQLVAPGETERLGVEPFPTVGARLPQLTAALGTALVASPDDPDQRRWRSPALPTGDAPTVATAVVADGVVVELVVEARGHHSDALRAALTAKYGEPTARDADPWRRATWTPRGRTVEATLDDLGARIAVRRRDMR
jgi:hypothetical protein